MERLIVSIEKDIRENAPQRTELLYLLWEFHRLIVKIQSHDICDWNSVSRHLNEELRIARELNDVNLQVLTLNQSCEVHLFRQNIDLARIDIDAAIAQARHTSPVIGSLVFANAARTRARGAYDLGDKMSVSKFLEQARNAIQRASISDERYVPAYVEAVKCSFTQVDAYMAIGKVTRAMEILDEIEGDIPPGDIRRIASLNLSRARCYTALKHPEYEIALAFLQDTFQVYKDVRSVHGIEIVEKTYRSIANSPYGNAPEVVDLGIALREMRFNRQ
jgi:tetratricopeptide (TPR) repeat protein